MVELWNRRGSKVRTYSGGMKRRLEIARGLLHHPRVLFLDEPTLGLDPQTRRRIWEYLAELRAREGLTIFLTTHSGLGILIGSFARSQQGFQLLMQMLVFPMIFLAGVFFPVDSVPLWMEVASKLNPVTYGVDAIRQIVLGSGPAAAGLGVTVFGHTMSLVEETAIVAGLGVNFMLAAVLAFRRQE